LGGLKARRQGPAGAAPGRAHGQAARLGPEHIHDQAAGAQAVQQQRIGALLAHAQQLKFAHRRQLQTRLQRRHAPAQLRDLRRARA